MKTKEDCTIIVNCKFHISHLVNILLFISIMGLVICKYMPFWHKVSVKSPILRWPLKPLGLLFSWVFPSMNWLKMIFIIVGIVWSFKIPFWTCNSVKFLYRRFGSIFLGSCSVGVQISNRLRAVKQDVEVSRQRVLIDVKGHQIYDL